MDLEPISAEPNSSDFEPLSTYQSATPTSFFTGPPVIHHHSPHCTLESTRQSLSLDPALSSLLPPTNGTNGTRPSASALDIRVSVFVLSTALTLWCSAAKSGVRIPYRAISLHARQAAGVYLQLCLDDVRKVADEDLRTLEVTLTPAHEANGNGTDGGADGAEAEKLFEALSRCAELWPDPAEEDEQGGLDLEGGQWITAENVGDFEVEAEGEEEEGEEGLGPGAGSRRSAGGEEDGEAETKWRRTE